MRLVGFGIAVFAGVLLCVRFLAIPTATYPILFGITIIGALGALAYLFYSTWFANQNS